MAKPTIQVETAAAEAQREPQQLQQALRRAEQDLQRLTRDHASELLALQQRVAADREAMAVAHARRLESLQQGFDASCEGLRQRFDALGDGLRQELDHARQRAELLEARLAQAAADVATARAEAAAASRRGELLEQELGRLREQLRAHPLQLEAARAAAERAVDRAAAAEQERGLARVAEARLEQRLALTEGLLAALSHELEHTQQRTGLALAAKLDRWLEQAGSVVATAGGEACPPVPADLEQLLDRGDRDYVEALYRVVMSREPDVDGLRSHLSHLRSGCGRAELARAFCESEEARRADSAPAWLRQWVQKECPPTRPGWRGWVERAAIALRAPLLRASHRLENRLSRHEQALRTELRAGREGQRHAQALMRGEIERLRDEFSGELRQTTERLVQAQDRLAQLLLPVQPLSAGAGSPRAIDPPDDALLSRARALLAGRGDRHAPMSPLLNSPPE